MSATGRGTEREAFDYYPTHAWCVHRLLDERLLPLTRPDGSPARWLEPAIGDGAIVRAVIEWCEARGLTPPVFDGIDIRDVSADVGGLVSTFTHAPYSVALPLPRYDVVITNPPFSVALHFAATAITHASHVALLQRVNWLASGGRADWMRAHTPSTNVLPDRPNFQKGLINPRTGKPFGGDATEYAWFTWGEELPRTRVLGSTPKAVRQAQRHPLARARRRDAA